MDFPGFQPGDAYVMEGGYAAGYEHGETQSPHVTHRAAMIREQEHKQELAIEKSTKASRFEFRLLEELRATNPSVRDGLDVDKERVWRRQYCKLIQDAGVVLRIPQWGIAVGITLCHRFFAAKSMKRNDRFLIATACLFLAAKIEESPRQLRNVIIEVEKVRNAKNAAALRALDDPNNMERLKEEVLQAERAVLYTLGFDLQIHHPYTLLIEWLNKEQLLAELATDSPFKPLVQNAWNLVNDSLRTTLCLQFTPSKIAWAALWMADLMNIDEAGKHHSKLPHGQAFYEKFQILPEELASICNQMLSEYEHSKLARLAAAALLPLPVIKADTDAKFGPGLQARPLPAARPVKMEEEEGEVQD